MFLIKQLTYKTHFIQTKLTKIILVSLPTVPTITSGAVEKSL